MFSKMSKTHHNRKAVLIGIDGATWSLIKPWIDDGSLPTLRHVLASGVNGTLTSTVPPYTLPAWTSIFTGVNPGKHGITDILIKEGDKLIVPSSSHRAVPSLWKILSTHGLKSIIVNDPVTYPPEHINGIMITGFLTPPDAENYVYPPQLKEEIEEVSEGYLCELPRNYDEAIARDKAKAYEMIQRFGEKTAEVALHLMHNYDWDVFAVVFTSTDRLQHFYWYDKSCIRGHYAWLDGVIKRFVDAANRLKTNVFFVSDHGFGPLKRTFYVNTWLRNRGYINTKKSRFTSFLSKLNITTEGFVNILKRMRLHKLVSRVTPEKAKNTLPYSGNRQRINKENSVAYLMSPTGGLEINRDLCKDKEYEEVKSTIVDGLLNIVDDSKKVVDHVYERQDVCWGPYAYRAPTLFVLPSNGYKLSTETYASKLFSLPIQHESQILRTGEHRPEGIFAAYGPDIKENIELHNLIQTWDIAPTILHLLGMPIPAYMDGRVLKEIFRKGSEPASRLITHFKVSEREKVKAKIKKIKLKSWK